MSPTPKTKSFLTRMAFAAIALATVSLSCGGGGKSSGGGTIAREDVCDQATQAACAKLFSCTDPLLLILQGGLGGTPAACETMIKASYCATFECTATQTYHGDKAKQCKDQFTATSCSDLNTAAGGALTGGIGAFLSSVPGCSETCTAAGSDAAATGQ